MPKDFAKILASWIKRPSEARETSYDIREFIISCESPQLSPLKTQRHVLNHRSNIQTSTISDNDPYTSPLFFLKYNSIICSKKNKKKKNSIKIYFKAIACRDCHKTRALFWGRERISRCPNLVQQKNEEKHIKFFCF